MNLVLYDDTSETFLVDSLLIGTFLRAFCFLFFFLHGFFFLQVGPT